MNPFQSPPAAEQPAREEDRFVAQRRQDWTQLQDLVLDNKLVHQLGPRRISAMGALYRAVCADLMRARANGYSHELVTRLDVLAARAHNILYGATPLQWDRFLRLLRVDFPAAVRRNARFQLVSLALFGLPFVVGMLLSYYSTDFAEAVVSKPMMQQMVDSYAEGHHGRETGTNAFMAGYYIQHNIGIAFRCFATGIFFGLGSVYFLFSNGLIIGCVMGGVMAAGHGTNILTFVCTHGAFELTAIVIAGGGGLQMGWALVETHGRSRLRSLQDNAGDIVKIVGGAAVMLFFAALIEGFWSPSAVPPPIKWSVASGLWLAVMAYFLFAGRRFA